MLEDEWAGAGGVRRFSPRGLQSGHTRDSSLAVAAGGPQRWRPCCKPNLACGRWLVRSSLGSRGTGALKSERKRGTHKGGGREEGGGGGGEWRGRGRHSSVDRNRVCNLRGVRPLRSLLVRPETHLSNRCTALDPTARFLPPSLSPSVSSVYPFHPTHFEDSHS